MSKPQDHSQDDGAEENEEVRAGSPPHHTTQPKGSGGSNISPQTRTNPNTGEPNPKRGDQE